MITLQNFVKNANAYTLLWNRRCNKSGKCCG